MKNMIFICWIFIFSSSAFSQDTDKIFKICLTGATVKNLPKYGEAFENGAKLALEAVNPKKNVIEIEKIFYENTALGALHAYKKALKNKCDSLIGFSTGNDLLSIQAEVEKNPLLTISIYGDPVFKKVHLGSVVTMQTTPEVLLKALVKAVPVNLSPKRRVLVITAVDRLEMAQYRDSLMKILKKNNVSSENVSVVEQTHDISELFEKKIFGQNWDFIFLFTKSLIAAELTDLLKNKKDTIFLGTKYFGSNQLPAYHNFLKNKNVKAYFARRNSVFNNSKTYLDFVKKYKKRFNLNPMLISSDAYDIVNFLILSLNDLQVINRQTVLSKILNQDQIMHGVSGTVFGPSINIHNDNTFVLEVNKKGYGLKSDIN